ncbi:MAG: hypothetical protein LBT83_10085 [Tannerella sp.]|nr:hypothetical protein [Tannerella sp.]
MARPIKETPIVYGKDAVRILKEIENPEPLSKERVEEIRKAGEWFERQPKRSYEEFFRK